MTEARALQIFKENISDNEFRRYFGLAKPTSLVDCSLECSNFDNPEGNAPTGEGSTLANPKVS